MWVVLLAAVATLTPPKHTWLAIPDIRPQGWLLTQETIQATTLGGHLEYFFVNGSEWLTDTRPPDGSNGAFNQRGHLETVPCKLANPAAPPPPAPAPRAAGAATVLVRRWWIVGFCHCPSPLHRATRRRCRCCAMVRVRVLRAGGDPI